MGERALMYRVHWQTLKDAYGNKQKPQTRDFQSKLEAEQFKAETKRVHGELMMVWISDLLNGQPRRVGMKRT
jgi:hypothetical protein